MVFTAQLTLRQVPSFLPSEFSRKCNLGLPPSNSSIFSFSKGQPVAPYVFSSSLPFHPFFNNALKAVPVQDVTNPISLPFFPAYMMLVSSTLFFIFHLISPTDFRHPSPAPRFKTSKLFLIYFSKRPNFRIIQSHILNVSFN